MFAIRKPLTLGVRQYKIVSPLCNAVRSYRNTKYDDDDDDDLEDTLSKTTNIFGIICIVREKHAYTIERLGKYNRIMSPGINFKIPIFEQMSHGIDLRQQQTDVKINTKSSDNVSVTTIVSIQYKYNPDKIREACYELDDPQLQMKTLVINTIRSTLPKLTLDAIYEENKEIEQAVAKTLQQRLTPFGIDIQTVLLTDIIIDPAVKKAMNDINEAQRQRVAAAERAEAEKIIRIKQAEADAESKHLQGIGIAKQREAITDGLCKSIDNLRKSLGEESNTADDIATMLITTQYYDTMRAIADNGNHTTIMFPHGTSPPTFIPHPQTHTP